MSEPRLDNLTRRHAAARRRGRLRASGLITTLCLALFLHVALLGAVSPLWPAMTALEEGPLLQPVTLVVVQPEEEPEPEEFDEDDDDLSGQIVDVAAPLEEEVPDEADYLAEHDIVVEEEMRTDHRRDAEVLSEVFSRDDELQLEDVIDLNFEEVSTGATPGQETFDPAQDGSMAALPNKYRFTNKEGLQAPTAASHTDQVISGSPSNDRLDEKRGEATLLSTKEFAYAAYLNTIKRLVSFYWHQNLDNVPGTIRLAKPSYTTVVDVQLAADGSLYSVEVTEDCGSPPLDNAVVEAFRIAGPYPAPPDGLVDADGIARLPVFGFTVTIGQARASYQGIDPRAGVQFPGILKAPR